MHRGYVKLWRKIEDSGLFEHPNAYVVLGWLMVKATRKPRKVIVKGRVIELLPGQVIIARRETSAAIKMGERSFRTAIDVLSKMEILTREASRECTVVTLINWNTYQECDLVAVPLNVPQTDPQPSRARPTTVPRPSQEQEVKKERSKEGEKLKEGESIRAADATPPPSFGPRQLMDLWNERAANVLPRCSALSDLRTIKAKARITEHPDRAFWESAIDKLNASDFCRGGNDRGWLADFDFIIQQRGLLRLVEGFYDNRKAAAKQTSTDRLLAIVEAEREKKRGQGISGENRHPFEGGIPGDVSA